MLGEVGLDFEGRSTHYVVNIILQKSPIAAYLGRLMWARRGDHALTTAHRIDVRQAIIVTLQSSGRPLTTFEIYTALSKDRGLGEHFQIHPVHPIIRLPEGLWGLIDRDINLTSDERATLIEALLNALTTLGHGLHISEIPRALKGAGYLAEKIGDPAILCTLARQTGKIKTGVGGYLYLSEWGESRRITVAQAIAQIIDNNPDGLALAEIEAQLADLIGRAIDRSNISSALQSTGARWDHETGLWLPSDEELESVDPASSSCEQPTPEIISQPSLLSRLRHFLAS